MGAFFDPTSMRGKITSAYGALVTAAAVLAVVAILDLLLLERQGTEGQVVSDLKDAVMEMRLEEKNLFLYKDNEALSRADEYAATSLNILRRSRASFGDVMGQSQPSIMIQNLDAYRSKLGGWIDAPVDGRHLLETEVRALGHQLYGQRRMLQSEKLTSLGILASGVAHELNNPLSNISSSCQLLMEELSEAGPDQINAWLKQIDTETERGRSIVRTLLDFGSQRVFQKDRIALVDLVDETRTIVGKTLRQYSAKLTVNIPSDLVVEVDKQRLQQLFINPIQNSLHAAGKGVQLRISAMASGPGVPMIPNGAEMAGDLKCINDLGGRFTETLIADNGPGIPAARLPKVFDSFFTTNEPGRGVGLGLFIVEEIVREHEGFLAIASRPGKGTQVIVLLPGEDSNRD